MKQREHDGNGLVRLADGAQGLTRAEAMGLLASVSYGRVIFTFDALPAVRPVEHLVDDGRVIIRARMMSAISTAERSTDGIVVAYEADSLDPLRRMGWSVAITGRAHTLTRGDRRCRRSDNRRHRRRLRH